MDGGDGAVSRVLVLSAEREARHAVVHDLLKLCGQEVALDTSQGVHHLALKTKYYSADLEVHVHAVDANELVTPLAHDADQYEALVWVVDAASDSSFLGTERFVGNSIEELEFNVSLVVGTRAASASLAQLARLEQWAQANGFEFVAVDKDDEKRLVEDDPLHEKRGMERVKEALECNMWASLQTPDKATATASTLTNQPLKEDADDAEGKVVVASKILVLGAEVADQHAVVQALVDRSGGEKTDAMGECVQELVLRTKYYEANVEFHLHRVDANELVTALQHEADTYEALVWVVDVSSDRSFLLTQQFVEKSIEELTFDVSLIVGAHVDLATASQVEKLETWCQGNGFEFVGVPTTIEKENEAQADDGKRGMDRVLEALHANMWSSMKLLPRGTDSTLVNPTVSSSKDLVALSQTATSSSSPPRAPVTADATDAMSHDERLQASLAAFSAGAGFPTDDDPDMEAFSGLLSQVQRIRESGAVLTDEERRRQAERVAMQLWSMLGSDGDEDEDSD